MAGATSDTSPIALQCRLFPPQIRTIRFDDIPLINIHVSEPCFLEGVVNLTLQVSEYSGESNLIRAVKGEALEQVDAEVREEVTALLLRFLARSSPSCSVPTDYHSGSVQG